MSSILIGNTELNTELLLWSWLSRGFLTSWEVIGQYRQTMNERPAKEWLYCYYPLCLTSTIEACLHLVFKIE